MTSTFDSHYEKVVKSVFDYYNKNDDEYLDFEEFNKLCYDYGFDLYVPQFEYIDSDNDGRLTYDEFKNWWLNKDKSNIFMDNIDNILYAYELFKDGINKYGEFNYDNFNSFISNEYSFTINTENFKKLDIDKDDKLNFKEFCSWLNWF